MELSELAKHNPHWAAVIYLFNNHSKLERYLTDEYIDYDNQVIEVKQLLKLSKPWSRSEQFFVNLAIHLYNGEVSVDLNDIDYLDSNNKQLVKNVLRLRFKGL
ncbi:hypothetical protein [Lentibacillus cibarius]|uniref:Uncharacterized protein n=1 Tax=Lentibacillus cibarius TaxID=2583219 RepID=A0A5S3QIT1_9BACI|nr:hypothetical protein [Lentibacillus cibarius]TMN21832.1 hypothetical protein FFL34_06680 [Lentibacillus cibarius]